MFTHIKAAAQFALDNGFGGAMIWAANPNPQQAPTGSTLCPQVASELNKILNPTSEFSVVPSSCCLTGEVCVQGNTTLVDKVFKGDCLALALNYVVDQARMMGSAAFAISCFLVLGLVSTFSLFQSIV